MLVWVWGVSYCELGCVGVGGSLGETGDDPHLIYVPLFIHFKKYHIFIYTYILLLPSPPLIY